MDDDDYGYGRTLGLMRILFEYGQTLLVPLAMAMAITPIVLYLVARSRAKAEPFPDPQLGLKFVLSYFKVISFHLLLAGVVFLVFALLMKGNDKSPVYRTGFGLAVPAAIVFGLHLLAMTRTNHAEQPMVGRMFAGWSLLISGVIGLAGFMLVSQSLFQKGSSGELGRLSWSLFLVYASAWIVQAARFFRQGAGLADAELPYYPPPPGALPPGVTVPAYAVPASPFAPPPPAGAAAYAPPPPSPFAPPGTAMPEGAIPTPAPAPSPFAPPGAAPPAAPVAPVAPTTEPGFPSPFAPPGLSASGPVIAPTPAPAVPVPAPMAVPLAPPRGPGSSGSNK